MQRRNVVDNKAFLSSLLDSIAGAILVLDNTGVIRYTTPSVENLIGYTTEEIVGKDSYSLLFSIDPERAKLTYQRVQRERTSLSAVLQLRHKKDHAVTVSLRMKNESLHPYISGSVVILHSITGWKEPERLSSYQKENIRSEEQRRLAQELHDGVNQTLTATKLLLETVLTLQSDWQPLVELSASNLQESITAIRTLSHQFLRQSDHVPSLKAALQQLVGTYQTMAIGISLRLPDEADKHLTDVQKHHLFRIVQEALTNTVKHAGATCILIHGTVAKGQFWVLVKDNGKGFNADSQGSGVGLNNIRHRVLSINGSLQIRSKPGSGTTLQIRVPFTNS